jgi:hypothetical protein
VGRAKRGLVCGREVEVRVGVDDDVVGGVAWLRRSHCETSEE